MLLHQIAAGSSKAVPPPSITNAHLSIPNTSPMNGSYQTIDCVIDGGVAPYVIKVVSPRGTIYTKSTTKLNTLYSYQANSSDTWLRLEVTDSLQNKFIGPNQSISVTYILSVSITYTTGYRPKKYFNLYANPKANPSASFRWYYRGYSNGQPGAWTFFSTSSVIATGDFSAGDVYEYYVTATNAAGTVTSSTLMLS